MRLPQGGVIILHAMPIRVAVHRLNGKEALNRKAGGGRFVRRLHGDAETECMGVGAYIMGGGATYDTWAADMAM